MRNLFDRIKKMISNWRAIRNQNESSNDLQQEIDKFANACNNIGIPYVDIYLECNFTERLKDPEVVTQENHDGFFQYYSPGRETRIHVYVRVKS